MPTAEDRKRNKEHVILAAISCLKQYGIEGSSQIMIAKAAHLSPRSIQRYFSSKSELVGEVVKYLTNNHCELFLSKYDEYDSKSHTGLQNLVYLAGLHGIYLDHDIELFTFFDEADMYLRNHGFNGDAMVMPIVSVDKLRKLFENAYHDGIADGSIRSDIDIPHEYQLFNLALTGFMYQIAAHSSHEHINQSANLQHELLNDFICVWMKHLKSAID